MADPTSADAEALSREIGALRAQLDPGGSVGTDVEKALERAERRADKDRSWIAYVIIGTYAAALGFFFIYVFANTPEEACLTLGAQCGPVAGSWKDAADLIKEVIGSAVLPIVTLVLGYYFGVTKARGDG